MGYQAGESRTQAALFPVMLEEAVDADAVVRVIDAWVVSLPLGELGFERAVPAATGRPPYAPADLLKLYLYGYLSGVRSSRRLERECRRNVEVMWLLGRLAPDHKTIAEFRRTQATALVAAAVAFVQFARRHRLVAGDAVAIDGTKVRAVASRKAVVGSRELPQQAEALRQRITQYRAGLDRADQEEAGHALAPEAVRASLQALRQRHAQVQAQAQRLRESGAATCVSSEPQARVMKHLNSAPGYNVQAAVDTSSHLIVHHEVVDAGNDSRQLAPMAQAAAQVLQRPELHVLADGGYSNGEHLQRLHEAGITAWVPPARAVNNRGDGTLYDRSRFTYEAASDTWRCPAGELLKRRNVAWAEAMAHYAPKKGVCTACPQKPRCTNADRRWVSRSLYEEALQAAQRRINARPEAMRLRRQTVEHPFGTIKEQILGNARLLLRGMRGARAEMRMAVLAYNLKRAVNMKGAAWMHQALAG